MAKIRIQRNRDKMIKMKYERKLETFKKETLNDVKVLHGAIINKNVQIRSLREKLQDQLQEIEIKNETINTQAVTMGNRALRIKAQRDALLMGPESIIELKEDNNDMLRQFRINEAILPYKILILSCRITIEQNEKQGHKKHEIDK